MPSILILEDGTGKANANAYTDASTARTYAAQRGVVLDAISETGDDPVEIALIKATDYLESLSYIGCRGVATQALSWPRTFRDSTLILPSKLVYASCQLCIEQKNGIVLMPSTPGGADGQFVIREKVDVIETQYSEKLGTLNAPSMPLVDSILRELVNPGFFGASLRSVRV